MKTDVLSIRLTKREQWLLSHLPPEYPGQPFSQRIRNHLMDTAGAQLAVEVVITSSGDRHIHLPKKLGLKAGQEPVPRPWPVK